ncbi:MAG: DUF882 domain-containing protein [Hyphomicrobium sp.]
MAIRAHCVASPIAALAHPFSATLNRIAVIAAALAGFCANPSAAAEPDRTISFHHIHTSEDLTVTYKKNGQFVAEALEKINWIMRDWRKNQAVPIDPNTIDIIWEMHEELGSREPVHIICGYRSRDTNEMLRRTVGGQASQSQHITGKAVDLTFPDVPLRRMRYSAMVRERGGVGYYPTSGVPFVHVDTSRVRHWPRMARDELAMIFPSGRSQHEPSDGGPITPADVAKARARNSSLATEIAAFFDLRNRPKQPVLVADAGPALAAAPKPAVRPAVSREQRMSVGAPLPAPEAIAPQGMPSIVAPKLVAAPLPADRPSRLNAALPLGDRAKLDKLVSLASLELPAGAVADVITSALAKAARPKADATPKAIAALPGTPAELPLQANPLAKAGARTAWVAAPDFDTDHPDELSYRPFPLLPLLESFRL